jgi:hypothetical protein
MSSHTSRVEVEMNFLQVSVDSSKSRIQDPDMHSLVFSGSPYNRQRAAASDKRMKGSKQEKPDKKIGSGLNYSTSVKSAIIILAVLIFQMKF